MADSSQITQEAREAELFRLLTENMPDQAVLTLDPDGRIEFWNAGAARLLGYQEEEVLGRSAEIFLPPGDRARAALSQALQQSLGEGRNHSQGWCVRRDGSRFRADLTAIPLWAPDQRPRGFAWIVRERTGWQQNRMAAEAGRLPPREQSAAPPMACGHEPDLLSPGMDGFSPGAVQGTAEPGRAELALRESEQRFARFMQHLPGLAWIKDANGRYVYANDAAVKTFRTPREELYGRTDADVFPPETAAQFRENDQRALASEAGVQAIEVLEHEDGVLHYSLVSKFPLLGSDGVPVLVGGMAIDITEQMQIEKSLRQSEEKLLLLADTIPQLAWMARPDGHIFWFNRRWYEYTGTSAEEVQGWGWQTVLDPTVQAQVLERWRKSMSTGEPFDMVYPLRGADGQFHPFLTRVKPLRDQEGQILHWFGTNTDISEIKQMEEALRDADLRKNEFLATLAHELRNPLAPIRTGLEVIRLAGTDTRTVEEVRGMMERQLDQLVRLIDDLLDITRITRNKLILRPERIELRQIIRNALETVQPLIEQKGHRLTVTLPPEPVLLQADPTRIAQIFANILTNAAKYTQERGRIWLNAGREGEEVVVTVRDTGIGIAVEHLPRLFQMFSQAAPALERSQGGLGIGLALVQKLVELHGGSIQARSEGLNQGSEFTVRLPLLSALEPPGLHPAPAPVDGRPSRPLRILVVDDNRDITRILALSLRLQGHEVHAAHDGQTAVEQAAELQPDTILLDIGLPGLNGYEACRRIRALPGGEKVTLIALTGWGQAEDKQRAFEAGFDYHCTKPLDAEELKPLLARHPR